MRDTKPTDVTLATFPREDNAFARFVRATRDRLIADGRGVTAAALEASLRRYHTRASVVPQSSLGAMGRTVWYVYRDGRPGVRYEIDWWKRAAGPNVAFDRETGRFIEADDAACALVDLEPGELVGRHWGDLVQGDPGDELESGLWDLLDSQGWAQSVFDFPRSDGGYRVIEYHTRRTDDPARFVSYWRQVVDIPPRPDQAKLPAAS